jgi:predicted transcriptional regulator
MSVKEQVLEAIQRLPDDINYRDVAEEIALLSALNEAESDIKDGRLVSNEEMRARLEKWGAK